MKLTLLSIAGTLSVSLAYTTDLLLPRELAMPIPTTTPASASSTTQVGSLLIPNVATGTINWGADTSAVKEFSVKHPMPTFFDTAERYSTSPLVVLGMGWGTTEERFADGIDGPKGAIVGTKFTPTPWRKSKKDVVEAALRSRERMGVDKIDLYSIHMPDIFSKDPNQTPLDPVYWDGLVECMERGIVSNVGVSNYGSTLTARCQSHLAAHGVPLAANQIHYSLLYNSKSEICRKACEEMGVATFGYFGLGMGLLTGAYSRDELLRNRDKYGLSDSHGFSRGALDLALPSSKGKGRSFLEKRDLVKYAATSNVHSLVAEMVKVAVKHGKTVSQVAINYCVTKNVIPIVGCSTVKQFESNMQAGGTWRLDAEDLRALESVDFAKFDGAGFKRSEGKFVGYGTEKWRLD
ncbi:hypothetical protein TrRE_jg9890 [Triparma retinervis]|uniref:NADP-dependent oxidoreductase domain-containing protein n=1 Tax=Triparma retinervis TaxID=2557542 RepID=A0A9W7CIH2_9STRA|nr:hypothetical protein TrRE_jg9890 [Triparma retinervis]